MTRHLSRTPLPSALSLAVAVAMAGCGSSNDDSPSDLQNDPSRPGTTVQPGSTTAPSGTTTPGGTTAPGGTATPGSTTTPGGTTEPSGATLLGAPDASDRLLPLFLAVARGEPIQSFLEAVTLPLPNRADLDSPPEGFTLTGRSQDSQFNDVLTYDCAGGGTATVLVNPAQQDQTTTFDTDACLIDGTRHTGTYAFRQAAGAQDELFQPSLELASPTLAGRGGGFVRRVNALAVPNGQVTREAASFQLTAGPSAGLDLADFSALETYDDQPGDSGPPRKTFSVAYRVTAPWTEGQPVTVRTYRDFSDFDRTLGSYALGILELSAPDGSVWRLDAANGDPATFRLDIASGNDTRTETLAWNATTVRLPCVSSDGSAGEPTEVLRRCESAFGE